MAPTIFTAAFLAAERELGEALGYPAITYGPVSLPTAPAQDNAGLEETRGVWPTEREAIEHTHALVESRDDALDTIAQLRADLDDAHQIIGQSIATMQEALDAMHRLAMRLSDIGGYGIEEDMQGGRNPATFQALDASIRAARAWLRRGAK